MNRNTKSIKLGDRIIYPDSKPYIIAEIGVNHEGSMDLAKRLIDLAKEGGADAAKFQSYKADTLVSKNSPAYWDLSKEKTKSQHELFKKYDSFDIDDYIELYNHCQSLNIDFLSTPFDDEAVEYLCPLMPFFKIASADLTCLPFLRKIGKKGMPVVLSTGASNTSEIKESLDTLKFSGAKEIILLHCILNYPTIYKNANLLMIKGLAKSFPQNFVGYSDHTPPNDSMTSLLTAYLFGAVVLEKHFTHDKSLPGNDHYHAMDLNDLKNLTKSINEIHLSLGKSEDKKPLKSEEIARLNARRSIVLKKDVKKNQILKECDLTYKRPGTGISPLKWDEIIGNKVKYDLASDYILKIEDLIKESK